MIYGELGNETDIWADGYYPDGVLTSLKFGYRGVDDDPSLGCKPR
jgi:hypothetical protein